MLVAGLISIPAGRMTAQTFTTLHSFTEGIDGVSPQAGLITSGNTLYGATEYGGKYYTSTIFALNTSGTGFITLYNFSAKVANGLGIDTNSDGSGGDGTLLLSGNTLYGTAFDGGTNGNGTVFALNTNGTSFTTLHSFAATSINSSGVQTNSDGANPEVGVIISGNTLYGTTEAGGRSGYGAVFKVNTNGTGFTTLYCFTNGSDGSIPAASLILSGNTLFGTTLGISGNGTVFALNTNGTGFTTLHSFTAINFTPPNGGPGPAPGYTNSDGVGPTGLILYGNTLYGTAVWGGTNGNGTVFALNTNGTGFTTLHSFAATSGFNFTNSEGAHPNAFTGLILLSNTLYGTALFGGSSGNGTVFALNTNGTGFTTLHNFSATNSVTGTNSDGAQPYEGLALSGNTLYGTAKWGGTSGDGTVFSIYLGLVVTTTSLPGGTNGVAYNQTLTATGGQQPYTWTNSSGALPPGLTLATNGLISGTPTNGGTFNFTVKVTDALSATATQPLTLTVVGPPSVTIQPTNNSVTVIVGTNVTFSVSVTGTGPLSYQWQLNGTNLPNGIITTVAGNGTNGYSGDGGVATNAELNYPFGVAMDTTGNLFIADDGNERIRKVGPNGIITTVAGNGTNGYSGDGGAATNAKLNYPSGVAVDAIGNLFIADYGNNRIRKVGINGIITTVAGNGAGGYSGDGGVATNAKLNYPFDVAVDTTGNLFIADNDNERIRKVGTNGIITTVAGNGAGGYSGDGGAATNAKLNSPFGVAVDTTGNLFIADRYNQCIRKVGTNGIINTVAGNGYGAGTYYGNYSGDGGAATNAELNDPSGVAVDTTGNLFIADEGNNRIRKVGTNGIIATVAGNGTSGYYGDGGAATNAELNYPIDVAVDTTGNLFIVDAFNNRIRKGVFQGPTMVLNDVGFGNAGAYDVVVSSLYGSVTSSVVNLTVTLPPVILSTPQITVGNTNFTFLLSGPAGSNYVLQVSTNLSNWSPVSTSTIPVSGSVNLSNAISGYNRRFYRVHLQ